MALIANGSFCNAPWMTSLIKAHSGIVAVDGGLVYCHQIGITPDLIIGDLDSVPADLLAQYAHVPIEKFPAEKDWTDLELAVLAVNHPRTQKIAIFGALGGRTDHALNNLHLARRYPEKVILEAEQETIVALQGNNLLDVAPGQTLSLIPLGAAAQDVNTRGLKWELHHATVDKEFMSISNVCLQPQVRIDIGTGDLICCLSRNQ